MKKTTKPVVRGALQYAKDFEMVLSAGLALDRGPDYVIRCQGPHAVQQAFDDLRTYLKKSERHMLYVARRQEKLDPGFVLGVFRKDVRGRIRYYEGWPDRGHPGRRLIACKAVFPLRAACVV
jgi:hypothetical protein